jgi:hypothetical protein
MSSKDFQEGVPFYQNVSSYNAHNLFICIRFLLNLSYPALLRVFSGIINLPNFFFIYIIAVWQRVWNI